MRRLRSALSLLVLLLLSGCATKPRQVEDTIDLVTPLPAKFDVQLPTAELPKPVVRFLGIWKGDWLVGEPGSAPVGILHHTLVVTKIEPSSTGDYRATVIYSAGAPPATWQTGGPGFWEVSAALGGEAKLRVKTPGPDCAQAVYEVSEDGQSLHGQYLLSGKKITGIFKKVR
jgi:hypothetical protein